MPMIAGKRAKGQMMDQLPMRLPTPSSTTRATNETALREAKEGLARAITADKPQHILDYWQRKVNAAQWLLDGDE